MSGSARTDPLRLILLACVLAALAGCGRTLEVGVAGAACSGRQFQSCAVQGKAAARLFCDASTKTWIVAETCVDACHVDWTDDDVVTWCINDFFTGGFPDRVQDGTAGDPDACSDGCDPSCGDNECSPGEICAADCNVEPKPPCGGPCPVGFACREESNACVVQTCAMPTVWANVQKVTTWAYSAKTEGCDLDGDGTPNNVLAKLQTLMESPNSGTAEDIAAGKLVTLFEAPNWQTNKPFALRVLDGAVPATKPMCDPTGAGCPYLVQPASYDLASPVTGTCPPRSELQAALIGGTLTAIAAKPVAVRAMLLPGVHTEIRLQGVQIAAQVTGVEQWQATATGRLCGYLTKDELFAAVTRIPPKSRAQLGDTASIQSLLLSLLKPDLDLDGDGTMDAISASFDFATAAATITGTAKQ